MLQAVRLDGPRRVTPEDFSDPSLLGTGEHGGRYRIRTAPRGPARASSPSRALRHDTPAASPGATSTSGRRRGRGVVLSHHALVAHVAELPPRSQGRRADVPF